MRAVHVFGRLRTLFTSSMIQALGCLNHLHLLLDSLDVHVHAVRHELASPKCRIARQSGFRSHQKMEQNSTVLYSIPIAAQ